MCEKLCAIIKTFPFAAALKIIIILCAENSLLNTNFRQTSKVSLSTDPKFSAPIANVTAAVGREAILTCQVIDLGSYKVIWGKNKHNAEIITILYDPERNISYSIFLENFFSALCLQRTRNIIFY